jgi:hypothetical protein
MCRGIPHPSGFLQKSAQVIENKGSEHRKERKKRKRVRNSMKIEDLSSGGRQGMEAWNVPRKRCLAETR